MNESLFRSKSKIFYSHPKIYKKGNPKIFKILKYLNDKVFLNIQKTN